MYGTFSFNSASSSSLLSQAFLSVNNSSRSCLFCDLSSSILRSTPLLEMLTRLALLKSSTNTALKYPLQYGVFKISVFLFCDLSSSIPRSTPLLEMLTRLALLKSSTNTALKYPLQYGVFKISVFI